MLLVCSDLQHYQALEEAQQKLGSHYDPLPAVAWADAGYEEEDAVALIRVKTEQVVKGLVNLYRVDVRRRMVAEPCPTPWLDKNKSLEFEDTNGIWKTLDDILSDYGADLKLAGETPASLSELVLQDYMARIGLARLAGKPEEVAAISFEAWKEWNFHATELTLTVDEEKELTNLLLRRNTS